MTNDMYILYSRLSCGVVTHCWKKFNLTNAIFCVTIFVIVYVCIRNLMYVMFLENLTWRDYVSFPLHSEFTKNFDP